MSPSNTFSLHAQRPGQHSPSLITPKVYRAHNAQSLANNPAYPSGPRSHHHNASITSNPSQTSQGTRQLGGGVEDLPLNQLHTQAAVSSPGQFQQQSAHLYNFEEDTSHHESSFDDFLTTECSSENHISEHTTPQELIWEQQFVLQDPSQPHILDSLASNNYGGAQGVLGGSDLHGLFRDTEESLPKFVSGEELLGPTSTTSFPLQTHTIGQIPNQDMEYPSSSTAPHRRGGSQSLKVDTTPNHTPSPNHKVGDWQRASLTMRAPSPVVMVSSYETSGAEPESRTQVIQSSGKRSRDSESSDNEDDKDEEDVDDDENRHSDPYSSHLMPPDPNDTNNTGSGPLERAGLEPHQRTGDVVLSVKDLEEQRQRDERNADVQTWLATSDAGDEPEDAFARNPRTRQEGSRRRAHTTGAQVDALGRVYSDRHIPGPGVLIDVETDDEYFDDISVTSSQIQCHTDQILGDYDESGSPKMSPQAIDGRETPDQTAFPTLEEETLPELQEPLPRQFMRRGPWQDPVQGLPTDTRDQPDTSNAAAYKFNQEAAKWETASRAATWGTRRRLSESEINSILEGCQVRHLSLSKRGRERGNSFLNRARGLLPRRGSSNIKQEEPTEDDKEPTLMGHAHTGSVGTIKPAQRMPSFSKPKSPQLNTGSAWMAMTGQLTAVGRGNAMAPEAETHKSSRPLQSLKKQRSKSDVSKHAKSSGPGLAELMTRHGGPPVPTLASPMHEREPILAAQVIDKEEAPADDDDDDQTDEVAIRMDLEIRAEDIIPTVEGFKDHARRLNPRLEPYLIDRIGQEQIRRYKKLVEAKIKHMRSVQMNKKCSSGKFCFGLGGEATLLAPRVSSKDPEATLTQFQVINTTDNEIDESGFTEGVVTPALFPPGIPLPPAKRLPAEFECHLCFKVKKFQKPSDWTKHVHEDVQPFSCTFPNCSESKSFKRKADWVRHENERHRHLEWWKCSIQECSHICYRKDNFVQHLVREHKMTEPKIKSRGSGSSKTKPVNNGGWQGQEDSEVWRMVETCRFETQNKPRDEPCRFCGNVCSSFKKLSVHMGKHMEQIAMPVLELVNMRQVTPETIISPIDQPQTMSSTMPGTTPFSLYPGSAAPAYQTPSAGQAPLYQPSSSGQSPVSIHGRSPNGGLQYEQGYYSPHSMTPVVQGQMVAGTYPNVGSLTPQSRVYMGRSEYMGSQDMGQQNGHNLSPQNQMVTPRSQPVGAAFGNHFYDSTGADYTQAPLHTMYANAPPTQGYVPQYASSMLQDPSAQSPMGVDGGSGLGLQTINQQYGYGAPGNQDRGANMPFS
ncbi:uncharacterized protein Z518_09498 [Rhinocladiella mackenziei CBS 650.93]|uniref:C2H2-type domain-containing protein n=1 Tax=Rhinocladiella mackenziei CBS 650.93 TaxID=1442369 RepID=A0A0D2IET3_9EURO|nr:uncharacterized protein Z518_09498 [Rhinocladiella mackenziei CBS 650.93]KIX01771.1 hypothetical protein Z518_09498 [Rhinocladiella mackenziei CBS 650.93]